jgi:hypothetical protein
LIELIITEIQGCDTQKEWYQFVYPASVDTREGDKNIVVGECGGDVRLQSRATELTGRPQTLTMIVKMMIIIIFFTSPFKRRNYCCEVYDSHDPSVHSDKIQRQVPVALKMKEDIFIL